MWAAAGLRWKLVETERFFRYGVGSGGVYILKGWMMQMNYMRELTDRERERERERERGVSGRLCPSVKTSERLGRCGVFDQL